MRFTLDRIRFFGLILDRKKLEQIGYVGKEFDHELASPISLVLQSFPLYVK